jgi:protein SCO1/2
MTTRFFPAALAAVLMVLAAAACSPDAPKFNSTDITGGSVGADAGAVKFTDHTGAPRTLADYRGKVVAVFFGFARCPDICPTNLAEWAQVRQQLGSDADKLQVIFITVDPQRDTQAILAGYVPAFDKSFVGLYADASTTKQMADKFKVFYAKAPNKDGSDYTIDHTAASYVLDAKGNVRLFVRHGVGVEPLTADIRQLLKG